MENSEMVTLEMPRAEFSKMMKAQSMIFEKFGDKGSRDFNAADTAFILGAFE